MIAGAYVQLNSGVLVWDEAPTKGFIGAWGRYDSWRQYISVDYPKRSQMWFLAVDTKTDHLHDPYRYRLLR